MAELDDKDQTLIRGILEEVLEIQKRYAFDPAFSKPERQKLVLKAIEKSFKNEEPQ